MKEKEKYGYNEIKNLFLEKQKTVGLTGIPLYSIICIKHPYACIKKVVKLLSVVFPTYYLWVYHVWLSAELERAARAVRSACRHFSIIEDILVQKSWTYDWILDCW